MKRRILFLLCLMATLICTYAQTGAWTGDIKVQGVSLPLVFHLDDENPTMDSPAQKANGIPIKLVRTDSNGISVSIPMIGASFEGKYENDEITGNFSQAGMTFPLVLHPGERKLSRPQTPQPPFPYTQEEVSFSNGDAVLKGTLTLPSGYDRKTPVVIMITGSGLQNRDEEIFEHKPFAVIADALARNGIASLRYDDRGFGESTGDITNFTTEDLKNDALAGIRFLRPKFNKVGVLGHSEGGTISFMLGSEKNVDFIVSLAGMIVSGKETILDQNRSFLANSGYSQQVIDDYCEALNLLFEGSETACIKLDTVDLPKELKDNLHLLKQQISSPYMQYLPNLDARKMLRRVTCPVLALNGTKDSQVSCEKNLKALNKGLHPSPKNKIRSLDGLNHLFQHCESGFTDEYATIEETFSPEALDIIVQWIKTI